MVVRELTDLEWPVETERLLVRPMTIDDVDEVWAYRRLPEVVRFLSHDVLTRDDVEERLAERIERASLDVARPCFPFAVRDRASGRLVGDAALAPTRCWSVGPEALEWEASVAYAFHPDVHGRGIATETLGALLRIGFDGIGLRRLTARAFALNHGSNRVLVKGGFRLEETHLAATLGKDGTWLDDHGYALLRDEWQVSQRP